MRWYARELSFVHPNSSQSQQGPTIRGPRGSEPIRESRRKALASEQVAIEMKKTGAWRYLFRAPVYLYRWHLGWLLGHRFVLLTHTGRSSGLRRQTVLEVVDYRKPGPEVVVVSAFGRDADWFRNIEAKPDEEVTVGAQHFAAKHRILSEQEAISVIRGYEYRNRFMAPIVRAGLSWVVGWPYRSRDEDRRRLVQQLPLVAFRPRR